MTTQASNQIVSCTWGYSMSIVEFFEIIKKTPKTVVLRKLKQTCNETGFLSGHAMPIEKVYENRDGKYEEVRAYKREYSGRTTFISNKNGYKQYFDIWNGQPKYYNHCD